VPDHHRAWIGRRGSLGMADLARSPRWRHGRHRHPDHLLLEGPTAPSPWASARAVALLYIPAVAVEITGGGPTSAAGLLPCARIAPRARGRDAETFEEAGDA